MLQTILSYVAGLSRRLTSWAFIVCATSVLGLCVVAESQTDSGLRQFEMPVRMGVGLVCVILVLVFRRRLKRDQEIEAGRPIPPAIPISSFTAAAGPIPVPAWPRSSSSL